VQIAMGTDAGAVGTPYSGNHLSISGTQPSDTFFLPMKVGFHNGVSQDQSQYQRITANPAAHWESEFGCCTGDVNRMGGYPGDTIGGIPNNYGPWQTDVNRQVDNFIARGMANANLNIGAWDEPDNLGFWPRGDAQFNETRWC
jgi:hypothetical protein